MRFIMLLCVLSMAFSLSAGKLEQKTARDSNGYTYQYVTDDPFNGREYTLSNGLKVYLAKIPVKPRITFKLAVRAGMADSPADATGLAHYFEHMMFKGTDRIGALDYDREKVLLEQIEKRFEERRRTDDPTRKDVIYAEIDRLSGEAARLASAGEYSSLIASIGGMNLNAFTASDMTVYVVDIPAQELEKLLKLESERMRKPVMRLFHTELEAVYEEFNRGMDNDGRLLLEAMSSGLFPGHPYGWTPFIGNPEHLKNPSITAIRKFFDRYYVPSNMALILAGDLDFDKTIRLVNQYFSHFPAGQTPQRDLPKAGALTADRKVQVSSPKAESLRIGFRVEPGRRNELLGALLADLLSNGTAGLLDRDLVRAQKVLGASAYFDARRDYSLFVLSGRPRKGQTLDQLSALLLAELDKVRRGDFDPALLSAVTANYRKSLVLSREQPDSAAWTYLDAFVKGQSYAENLRIFDDLEKITKTDIVNFAQSLGHYVRADKVTGPADSSGKVAKPAMTPVAVNPHKRSDYAVQFAALPRSPLPALDVIDFQKDFSILPAGKYDRLFYNRKPSPANDTLFTLQMYVEAGSACDPLLPLALDYLNYLGTTRYSANALRQEFFRKALDFSFSCESERSSLNLSGFGSDMEYALALSLYFLRDVQPDENAWHVYVERLLKGRADAKKNQQASFRALNFLAAYGTETENNPVLFASSVSEKQLRSLTGADMVALVRKYFGDAGLPRLYAYVGPAADSEVTELLRKTDKDRLAPAVKAPARKEFRQLPTERPRVLLLPYDSAQFLMGIRSRGVEFDLSRSPLIRLFNQYFGAGGLDDVVFQEIRESRSLAYSAYAVYQDAMEKNRYDVVFGFAGTQPDKFFEAADAMLGLFRKMPLFPEKVRLAKEKLLKEMSAQKHYGNLIGFWFKARKMGLNRDWRPEFFRQLETLTAEQVADFAAKEIAPLDFEILVVGPADKLDRARLEKYGPVRTVTPQEIFGY